MLLKANMYNIIYGKSFIINSVPTITYIRTHTNSRQLTHSHIYTYDEMNYIHILTSCKIYLEIPTQSQNHKITTSPNHPPSQSRATHIISSIHIRPPLHQQSSHFRVTIGCCLVQGGPLILCGEIRTAGEEGEAQDTCVHLETWEQTKKTMSL